MTGAIIVGMLAVLVLGWLTPETTVFIAMALTWNAGEQWAPPPCTLTVVHALLSPPPLLIDIDPHACSRSWAKCFVSPNTPTCPVHYMLLRLRRRVRLSGLVTTLVFGMTQLKPHISRRPSRTPPAQTLGCTPRLQLSSHEEPSTCPRLRSHLPGAHLA